MGKVKLEMEQKEIEELVFEIGNLIHVRRTWFNRLLEPIEIINSYEYKMFKTQYPRLCRLVEELFFKSLNR